ncbi:hypothetical protein PG984_006947 [Apiospora sp. TS-2023a]
MASSSQRSTQEPESLLQGSKRKHKETCSLLSPDGNDLVELVMKRATRERKKSDGKSAEMDRQVWLEFARVYDLTAIRDLFDQCLHADVVETCRTLRSARDLDGLPVAHLYNLESPNMIDALAHGNRSGWYLLILFDEDDNVECMLYVGQALDLCCRVQGHRTCAFKGHGMENLLYYMWALPGKHAKAVYLGHIEPDIFRVLLHKQCLLNLGEELLSVYLQSLHPSMLTRYLDKSEILHEARALQRKFPLEGGTRGQTADIAWLQSSWNEEYIAFARQRLADRPFHTLRWALECGLLRPARSGQPRSVELICKKCKFRYVDPTPYYVSKGAWEGYYHGRNCSCLMRCWGGPRGSPMVPTDPQLRTLPPGAFSLLQNLHLGPATKTPARTRDQPYARSPAANAPQRVEIQCDCCRSFASQKTDDVPRYSVLGRRVKYICFKSPCAALCCGVGPSSLHNHEPVDSALPRIKSTQLSYQWSDHVHTITTNHSMDKFVTDPRETEAGPTFSPYSLWGYLESSLDESDVDARDEFSHYSLWHHLGAEAGESIQQQDEEEVMDDFTQNSIWNFLGSETDVA